MPKKVLKKIAAQAKVKVTLQRNPKNRPKKAQSRTTETASTSRKAKEPAERTYGDVYSMRQLAETILYTVHHQDGLSQGAAIRSLPGLTNSQCSGLLSPAIQHFIQTVKHTISFTGLHTSFIVHL